MEPLIAVVGRRFAQGGVPAWPDAEAVAVPAPYIRALHRSGAREAVLLPSPLDEDDARRLLSRFDGLLLIGGPDVDPARYGQQAHPAVYGIDRDRDAFEAALVRTAIDGEVPVLAICRGIQLLNVALGGTLDQHVPDREGLLPHGDPQEDAPATHAVRLEPGSQLAKAMGREEVECSSHHHQGLARLGEGLAPVGWSGDGLIEGVEMEDRWVLGVQWHPEITAASDPAQQGLFDALVDRATSHPQPSPSG
jgi:putative glutamine amidotransferase